MRNLLARKLLLTICLSTTQAGAYAQSVLNSIETAFSEGTANVSLRFRHEMVDQNNLLKDADATTLRTRLTYKTGTVNGISGLLEFDNVSVVGSDDYDSLVTNEYRGSYSIIADPVGSEVNQALINYAFDESNSVVFGMQRILHAGQRFVGGIGWRQNEQTFDALSYRLRDEQFDIDYSYIWNVNRIFASSKPSVQLENLNSDSHILLATRKAAWGNLSGYVYALDFSQAAALSSVTYGLSYTGKLGPVALNASIARQSDYGDNPQSYDANYYSLDAAIDVGPLRLLAGYELLGSDGGITAVQTPLATLHKWQGWSDLFLTTPASGIEDGHVTVSGKLGDLSLAGTFHNLEADEGSMDYGTEWDLVATYPLRSNIEVQLKYATYDKDGYAVDTDKLWLMLSLTF